MAEIERFTLSFVTLTVHDADFPLYVVAVTVAVPVLFAFTISLLSVLSVTEATSGFDDDTSRVLE